MRKDKDDQRDYIREYMRETRAFYHSRGRCAECGKEDAYTIGGRYRCAECAEKRRQWNPRKDRDKENAKARNLRADRREKGLCTECGAQLPSDDTHMLCPSCRALSRARNERKRRAQGIEPRSESYERGVCYKCQRPLDGGMSEWSGKPLRVCLACAEKSKASAKRAEEALVLKTGRTYGQLQFQYAHGREKAKDTEVRRGIHTAEDGA